MDFETLARARAQFDEMVAETRPQLLRYCSRMLGSAVDGEDVVQEALARVYYRLPRLGQVDNLRAWLFRVAHNKALDHLRRYDVRFGEPLDGELPVPLDESPVEAAELAEWGLSYFTRLTPLQRSAVILKDVLSYSLEEISEILDASVPSIKGALHRGRAALRSAGAEAPRVSLEGEDAALLRRYVTLWNARDFDALRAMLAEDVRLDLVEKAEKSGAASVANYFENYSRLPATWAELGTVDGRIAILVRDSPLEPPSYCLFLRFRNQRILAIRDYRYARHVFAEAEWKAGESHQAPGPKACAAHGGAAQGFEPEFS